MKTVITRNASLSEVLSSFDNKGVKVPGSWRAIGAAIEEALQKKGITEIHLEIPEKAFGRYTVGFGNQNQQIGVPIPAEGANPFLPRNRE